MHLKLVESCMSEELKLIFSLGHICATVKEVSYSIRGNGGAPPGHVSLCGNTIKTELLQSLSCDEPQNEAW